MKRITLIIWAVLGVALSSTQARAGGGQLTYSGSQTSVGQNPFQSWQECYAALKSFASSFYNIPTGYPNNIDWVAYYQKHGYQINSCDVGGCGRLSGAPVFVSPTMQWALPAGTIQGPVTYPPYPSAPNGTGGY